MLRVNTRLSEIYLGKVKMRDEGVRRTGSRAGSREFEARLLMLVCDLYPPTRRFGDRSLRVPACFWLPALRSHMGTRGFQLQRSVPRGRHQRVAPSAA